MPTEDFTTSMDVDVADDSDLHVYCEESSIGESSPGKLDLSGTNSIPDSIGDEAKAQSEEHVPEFPSLGKVCTCAFLFASFCVKASCFFKLCAFFRILSHICMLINRKH